MSNDTGQGGREKNVSKKMCLGGKKYIPVSSQRSGKSEKKRMHARELVRRKREFETSENLDANDNL